MAWTPCQQQAMRIGCPVPQRKGRLWAGVQTPSGFLPWLGRTGALAEIMLVDPKCTCGGIILLIRIDWPKGCLGSETGFLSHPLKTFLRLHGKLQHK